MSAAGKTAISLAHQGVDGEAAIVDEESDQLAPDATSAHGSFTARYSSSVMARSRQKRHAHEATARSRDEAGSTNPPPPGDGRSPRLPINAPKAQSRHAEREFYGVLGNPGDGGPIDDDPSMTTTSARLSPRRRPSRASRPLRRWRDDEGRPRCPRADYLEVGRRSASPIPVVFSAAPA